jgi:dTDP-glucose 4,6-dehydratase
MMSRANAPVNLGNPREMTVLEFAREILRITESPSRIVFRPLPQDDPRQRRPDITRARQELGWEPKVGLAEGLRLTSDHFRGRVRS